MIHAILTIDDIGSENPPAIVDYLTSRGIQAVMFAVGKRVEAYPRQSAYAVEHGMVVGNHSYSHPHFSELSAEDGRAEILACERVLDDLYRTCGVPRRLRPFRFPYGDKGGAAKEALQAFLRENGFHKLRDDAIPFPFWKASGLDREVDTLWTYDFAEYNVRPGSGFTWEDVWKKLHDPRPLSGAPLFEDGARHILLLHAHDETERMVPGYYRKLIDHLLENGVVFDPPAFFDA